MTVFVLCLKTVIIAFQISLWNNQSRVFSKFKKINLTNLHVSFLKNFLNKFNALNKI